MKRTVHTLLFFLLACIQLQAQSLTIVSPAGLNPPYEVAPGTEVTFQWDYFFEVPSALFTNTEFPVFPDFGTDPAWTEFNGSGAVDNGDGTFNITITINESAWVWGGFFAPFLGQWAYSNVLEVSVASNVVISGSDLLLCDDGVDTELLSVTDTFTNYQWYMNDTPIANETTASYLATSPGAYRVAATANGETVNSNTLNLSYISIGLTGALSESGSEIILSTDTGMDSYQWLSGPDADNLSPIVGANSETYNALLNSDLTYYAAEATLAGCTVRTEARPVVNSYFVSPAITVAADTNSFNVVCSGTPVTYSVDDTYASYQWIKDGFNSFSTSNTITLSQQFEAGNYTVEVTTNEWPEITITSEEVALSFQNVIQPRLFGVVNFGQYCPGEEVNVTLGDEGYNYTWYAHAQFNSYTEQNIIEPTGSTYSFVYDTAVYLTVVANFQGCSSSRSVFLNSYESASIFLSTSNFNQDFLCIDSTNTILLPGFLVADYQNFQWQQELNGTYEPIPGADTSFLEVTEPGIYRLEAAVAACPSIIITSPERIIRDYTERELRIWADSETLCVGEETTLNISAGFNWNAIQWFEEDIVIGNMGYEKTYVPIIGAGSETSLTVSEFQTYQVKARHQSCPNGLKTTSNIVGIKPTVNPSISPTPDYGINDWKVAAYDSIPSYIFCSGEPVTLALSGQYDSYSWHTAVYQGDDDYEIGMAVPGATTDTLDIFATSVDWYTAIIDSAGCVGYSDPILIDTWAFQSPVIASYDNNEICEDEPVLLNIAFPGDWVQIEWTLNGELIPNSNNDSIFVNQPGEYLVFAYPSLCPEFAFSSGLGPLLTIFNAEIIQLDTVIYAVPFDGASYTYQWYLDGEPVDSDPDLPWVIFGANLMDGVYTVDITNSADCFASSEPSVWVSTEEIEPLDLKVYPNPTNGQVFIEGLNPALIEQINVFNVLGAQIQSFKPIGQQLELDLSNTTPGLYIINVQLKSGKNLTWRVSRY